MATVTMIPARQRVGSRKKEDSAPKVRVAAYCRVSTETDTLQCDANQLLSDVLDVTTSQESGLVSRKLQALPVDEQRRLLRVLEVMIDER